MTRLEPGNKLVFEGCYDSYFHKVWASYLLIDFFFWIPCQKKYYNLGHFFQVLQNTLDFQQTSCLKHLRGEVSRYHICFFISFIVFEKSACFGFRWKMALIFFIDNKINLNDEATRYERDNYILLIYMMYILLNKVPYNRSCLFQKSIFFACVYIPLKIRENGSNFNLDYLNGILFNNDRESIFRIFRVYIFYLKINLIEYFYVIILKKEKTSEYRKN